MGVPKIVVHPSDRLNPPAPPRPRRSSPTVRRLCLGVAVAVPWVGLAYLAALLLARSPKRFAILLGGGFALWLAFALWFAAATFNALDTITPPPVGHGTPEETKL